MCCRKNHDLLNFPLESHNVAWHNMATAAHMLIAEAAIVRAIQPNNFTIMLLVLVLVHFAWRAVSSMGLQHPICSIQKTQVMCTEVGWGEKMFRGLGVQER